MYLLGFDQNNTVHFLINKIKIKFSQFQIQIFTFKFLFINSFSYKKNATQCVDKFLMSENTMRFTQAKVPIFSFCTVRIKKNNLILDRVLYFTKLS